MSFPKFAPASNTADAWSADDIVDLNDIFAGKHFVQLTGLL